MATLLSEFADGVSPTPADARVAQESSLRLVKLLQARKRNIRLCLLSDDEPAETIPIPLAALGLLAEVLTEMAKGNAVTLMPIHAELTSQQAADLLNVSRPHLIELLEKGQIPHRKVGTHRRVLFQDLMAYKQKIDGARLKALEDMSALDQELGGMGY